MSPGPAGMRRPLLVSGAVALLVAGVGGAATRLDGWYYALQQPAWKPPDALFGPAWTLIFALSAWSAALGWVHGDASGRRRVLAAFAANGLLNVLWSVLFFTLQRPDWALMEVPLLWASIVVAMLAVRPARGRAIALLVPYLCWVSFAAVLNLAVVRMNGPFG